MINLADYLDVNLTLMVDATKMYHLISKKKEENLIFEHSNLSLSIVATKIFNFSQNCIATNKLLWL